VIGFAVALGLTGAAVLLAAGRALWISRPYHPGPCALPSPDDDGCSGTLAHVGWHHADGREWYGDAWRDPTNTVAALPDWRDRPMGNTGWALLAAGLVAFGLLVAGGVETLWPSPPAGDDPHATCAMRFEDANALHPLCNDSPWWAEHGRTPPP
jgi:hypothetical protein